MGAVAGRPHPAGTPPDPDYESILRQGRQLFTIGWKDRTAWDDDPANGDVIPVDMIDF
jgi:hypothetical protein